MEWAFDVRLLLAESDIPHCADMVRLDDLVSTRAEAESLTPGAIEVWGCMSLYHHYQRSGERSAQRTAFEPKPQAARRAELDGASEPMRGRLRIDSANTVTAGIRKFA